jgi:hypothetical protein
MNEDQGKEIAAVNLPICELRLVVLYFWRESDRQREQRREFLVRFSHSLSACVWN